MSTRFNQVVATTALDAHNEQRTPEQLRMICERMPETDVMYEEHDTGTRPIARIFNKRITVLPDGHHALVVDIDVLDESRFDTLGGYSISYTLGRFTVDAEREAELAILINPRVFPIDEAKRRACKTDDALQIDVVQLHQKSVEGVAIIVLEFVSLSAATWFIRKLLDGALSIFRDRLRGLTDSRRATSGGETCFHLIHPLTVSDGEVDVLVEVSSDTFGGVSTGDIAYPSVEGFRDRLSG